MSLGVPVSRCSESSPIIFYWFGVPPIDSNEPIDAALSAFEAVMKVNGRLWNPYAWIMAKKEFQSRIEAASRGELVPVDHVKDIDSARAEHLFEIRWEFQVLELREDGLREHHGLQIRMYHSEPPELPFGFVGLHLHEKNTDESLDINALQNEEIRVAIRRYEEGRPLRWGVI